YAKSAEILSHSIYHDTKGFVTHFVRSSQRRLAITSALSRTLNDDLRSLQALSRTRNDGLRSLLALQRFRNGDLSLKKTGAGWI
ncbi:MAG: hypothetical protein WCV56_08255, partial [Candidatus Omnitrophota bacterium]